MKNKPRQKSARLLYAASESNADMLYFAGMFVPDAFIALQLGSKKVGVLNRLEYARAVKESAFSEVLALESLADEARQRLRLKRVRPVDIIRLLAKKWEIGQFKVPENFPAGIAFDLKKSGIGVEVVTGDFFSQRAVKSAEEAAFIRAGNRASAAGIRAAERVLRAATINRKKGGQLFYQGKVLTAEHLRMVIDIACLEAGAVASHTICAGGKQACDPHCVGYGPLRCNELIIVDVFPRVSATGYHGDMTRTFLKGEASSAQIKLVKAVAKAQKAALQQLKAGVNGRRIHAAVNDVFTAQGYVTEAVDGVWTGFFHGTGHGLGLEVHEAPRVSTANGRLKNGAVVTIEPGLYYPEVGGCRIEDVAWVQQDGCELLSKYPYRWVLS